MTAIAAHHIGLAFLVAGVAVAWAVIAHAEMKRKRKQAEPDHHCGNCQWLRAGHYGECTAPISDLPAWAKVAGPRKAVGWGDYRDSCKCWARHPRR